jgi:prepilin-type N-terminal cleavage/methylation domain-containing protein
VKVRGDINSSQRGFTLVEMVIVIGLLAAVMGVLSATIFTMMRGGILGRDREVALTQNQEAGYWISRDVQKSRADISYDSSFLTLTVPEWNGTSNTTVDKTVSYQFENITGNRAELARYTDEQKDMVFEAIYYNTADTDSNTRIISCAPDDEEDPNFWVLNFQITTTTSGQAIVQREYEARQRVQPLYDE